MLDLQYNICYFISIYQEENMPGKTYIDILKELQEAANEFTDQEDRSAAIEKAIKALTPEESLESKPQAETEKGAGSADTGIDERPNKPRAQRGLRGTVTTDAAGRGAAGGDEWHRQILEAARQGEELVAYKEGAGAVTSQAELGRRLAAQEERAAAAAAVEAAAETAAEAEGVAADARAEEEFGRFPVKDDGANYVPKDAKLISEEQANAELKRLVAKRKAAAEAVAQAQEATAAGGGGMLPSRLKITSRAVRKEGSEVEALAERDKARRGRGSGRSGPGG
jgi:hypothetical protein